MNKDTPPNPENLVEIKFAETLPDVSWYRHESWQQGQYKRFRHCHTMSQNITGFTFYNEKTSPHSPVQSEYEPHSAGSQQSFLDAARTAFA